MRVRYGGPETINVVCSYCMNFSSSLLEALIGGVFVALPLLPLGHSAGIANTVPNVIIAS